jgi:hypothetical protein
MRNLLKMCLIAALILTVSGTAQAVTLQSGPIIWKAFNYDEATSYADGSVYVDPCTLEVSSRFYFRTTTTQYWTDEHGLLSYDATNPAHGLFSDLSITYADNARPGEDSWGLLEVTQIFDGTVIDGGFNPATGQDSIVSTTSYWASGDDGEWLNGTFWGVQDDVVEWVSANDQRIWSSGGRASLWETDGRFVPTDGAFAHSPYNRPADTTFPDWTGAEGDEWLTASLAYYRFSGFFDLAGLPEGDTTVYMNIDGGSEYDPPNSGFRNFWEDPFTGPYENDPPGAFPAHFLQTWKIGAPFKFANGWVGSEDTAKGIYYVVPEPMTMLGVFLGVGSLAGYVRKRRGHV